MKIRKTEALMRWPMGTAQLSWSILAFTENLHFSCCFSSWLKAPKAAPLTTQYGWWTSGTIPCQPTSPAGASDTPATVPVTVHGFPS